MFNLNGKTVKITHRAMAAPLALQLINSRFKL